jgi:SagB-type dehydrogenase family enzyme
MKTDENASFNQIGFASQFVDADVEYQVREFHQACMTPVGSGFENLFGFSTVTASHLKRAEFVETRFSHLTRTIDIPGEKPIDSVGRSPSLHRGDPEAEIEFSLISSIFRQALAADQQRRRPYPSGGALYAVEAILITGPKVQEGQRLSALHFLPVSNAFEQLTAHVSMADFSSLSDVPDPSFYVLYCVNLKKSIFKYRSRGYRLSLLEVGSMYQNMLVCAQSLGVSSRVLSGFPERQICTDVSSGWPVVVTDHCSSIWIRKETRWQPSIDLGPSSRRCRTSPLRRRIRHSYRNLPFLEPAMTAVFRDTASVTEQISISRRSVSIWSALSHSGISVRAGVRPSINSMSRPAPEMH